jgi:hypothetical protein
VPDWKARQMLKVNEIRPVDGMPVDLSLNANLDLE